MANLTIYRASAGSGKTFTLAVEYMALLINDPHAYKHILAVTFTNKATEEMKMRILSQLYALAYLPKEDNNSYLLQIKAKTGLDETTIRSRAKTALQLLLHNYNYFRVETIDAFFQTVLRNLARELELNANLNIALNDQQIEEVAVDEMIEELNEHAPALNWIMEYISDTMHDDKSWNVIGKIKEFGKNIFRDDYKANVAGLEHIFEDKDFFYRFKKQLKDIEDQGSHAIIEQGNTFFVILDKHGISTDAYLNNVVNYFAKLKAGKFQDVNKQEIYNKTMQAAALGPDGWVRKADKVNGNAAYDLAQNQLVDFLQQTELLRTRKLRQIFTAQIIRKHIDQLRLLKQIENKVKELNNDHNRFLLSNTQTLLHELIRQSDSPFVFEKIGMQLEHIMIDEFQDTSNIQWDNFKVLLQECMSHENAFNLIVGDVKQSIYRWRDGNWRLLNNLEKQFNSSQLNSQTLTTNYRSNSNIIRFNNDFFSFAKEEEYKALKADNPVEAEELQKAYTDVVQLIPERNKEERGLVEIKLINSKSEAYHHETLELVANQVQALLNAGIAENQIAILVRTNPIIQEIGDYFMEYMPHVRLVSDEAFHLDASLAVNIMIDAMRVIVDPNNTLAKAALLLNYHKNIKGFDAPVSEILIKGKNIDNQLPIEFITRLETLALMPIMEMAESVYQIFELCLLEKQSAYICAFFDQLGEYLKDNITDIGSFLKYWDEDLHKVSIQSSEHNGIRLITLHKSKGLEFDNVLMPFCDWAMEKQNVIWCKPTEAPYNQLSLVPVDYNKYKMTNSIFDKDYNLEHLQNVVDNLNLLYVGFTRAKRNLFVYGQYNSKVGNRSQILQQYIQDESYTIGTLDVPWPKSEQKVTATKNVFESTPQDITIKIENYKTLVDFRQSNKSKEFVTAETGDEATEQQRQYIQLGNVFHHIFASIQTTQDIPKILEDLEKEGVLFDNYLTKEKLISMLKKRFTNKVVKDWFSDRWDLFNECSILRYDSITNQVIERRPDRVMSDGKRIIVVDFKFGKEREQYKDQVREYMLLLRDMGYQQVEGYLWYVYANHIEQVL